MGLERAVTRALRSANATVAEARRKVGYTGHGALRTRQARGRAQMDVGNRWMSGNALTGLGETMARGAEVRAHRRDWVYACLSCRALSAEPL